MRVCVRALKMMTLLESNAAKRSTRANTTRSCRRIERPCQSLRKMRHQEAVAAGDPKVGTNCTLMAALHYSEPTVWLRFILRPRTRVIMGRPYPGPSSQPFWRYSMRVVGRGHSPRIGTDL